MTIEIHRDAIVPGAAFAAFGETIEWVNMTGEQVLLAGEKIGRRYIGAGDRSDGISIPAEGRGDLGSLGVWYHAIGASFVVSGSLDVSGAGALIPSPWLDPLTDKYRATYKPEDWGAMQDTIAACWVFDLLDNVENNLINASGLMNAGDTQLLKGIKATLNKAWSLHVGEELSIDADYLLGFDRAQLEPFGRLCKTLWRTTRNGRIPQRPSEGAALDFGRKIKALNSAAVEDEYKIESKYSSAALDIECEMDIGNEATTTQVSEYISAKGAMSRGVVEKLRDFLELGLKAAIGSQEFQPEVFKAEMKKMTEAGRWTSSEYSLWHWLRFCDLVRAPETHGVADLREISKQFPSLGLP